MKLVIGTIAAICICYFTPFTSYAQFKIHSSEGTTTIGEQTAGDGSKNADLSPGVRSGRDRSREPAARTGGPDRAAEAGRRKTRAYEARRAEEDRESNRRRRKRQKQVRGGGPETP